MTDEHAARAAAGLDPEIDGWQPHNGGPSPVAQETRVSVRFRNGLEQIHPFSARTWDWSQDGGDLDIIAYRIVCP